MREAGVVQDERAAVEPALIDFRRSSQATGSQSHEPGVSSPSRHDGSQRGGLAARPWYARRSWEVRALMKPLARSGADPVRSARGPVS
jgi:hypothetical protein